MSLPLYQLQSVSADKSGQAGIASLNGLEKFTPAEQVAGVSIVFLAMLNRYGVSVKDAIDVATNLYAKSAHEAQDGQGLRAIRKFVRGEW